MKKVKILFIVTAIIISITSMGIAGDDEWTTTTSTDEMTGAVRAAAISPITSPTTCMNFPYNDITARLYVVCEVGSQWTYIQFSDSPNLNNTDTEEGRDVVLTRVKWDDSIQHSTLIQEWGANVLHFKRAQHTIRCMMEASTVLIELDWYGNGTTYFKFSLKGSTKAINKARKLVK